MDVDTYNLVTRFVLESNRIESIRDCTEQEVTETYWFINLSVPSAEDVQKLALVYTPAAKLRVAPGMDVRVGNHIPPRGGAHILDQLFALLLEVTTLDVVEFHQQYETLHPFMDGNGRTGRALWAWQMVDRYGWNSGLGLGFLHRWYYQTLDASRK